MTMLALGKSIKSTFNIGKLISGKYEVVCVYHPSDVNRVIITIVIKIVLCAVFFTPAAWGNVVGRRLLNCPKY